MNVSSLIGLLQNTAILLALSLLYEFWWNREAYRTLPARIFTGIMLGITGIILMLTPWTYIPGIYFDTRSILLSVSGLFFGVIPTLIAMLITGIIRIIQGGGGMWMGLAVIILSGLTGIIWNKIRPGWKEKKYLPDLIILGYVVHLLMLLCTLLLPRERIADTVRSIFIPLITVYPLGTVLLGSLLVNQYRNWQNRLAAKRLEESERRFIDMLKNTSLFSIIIDYSTGKIAFCNRAFLDATGYTEDDLMGRSAIDTLALPEKKEEYRKRFINLAELSDGRFTFEAEILKKTGDSMIISWNYNLLKNETTGKIDGIACIGENITARKQAEREIILARQKAEENDRLKTVFLSNMSHEIRTPLNAILGFTSLMAEEKLNDEEKNNFRKIISGSSERLLNIINDIVDISKIEAGQLNIIKTPGSLYHLVSDVVESIKISPLLREKKEIEIELHYPQDLTDLNIITDHKRIQQVLSNLIVNAVKFTEKGKIATGVEKISENGKGYLKFFVRDSGQGIPDDKKELIFNRFTKINSDKYQEGAGLGLSIAKGIVEALEGEIWFDSVYGKGTVFYFTIPCIETDAVSPGNKNDKVPEVNLIGKKIIIAEDDNNSFLYIKQLLRNSGAVIIHAENGKDLIDKLGNFPDTYIVLLDIAMPVMDGYEALEILKKKWPHITVIAQTAYAFANERELCLSKGCDAYIAKPFNSTGLMATIHEALQKRHSKGLSDQNIQI